MSNSIEAQLAELRSEVAALRGEARRRRRQAWLALAVALGAASAWAQLVTFQQDGPARAAEVNGNFTQLQTWLEQKVGSVSNAGVVASSVRSTTLTNTGLLTTNSLSVTAGLPLTVEPQVEVAVANAEAEEIATLGAANGRRMCFLVGYDLHDTMANESQGWCYVEVASGNWQLRVDVTQGDGDPDILCRARCLSW